MTKEQRIAILTEALAQLKRHEPSLEAYTEHHFMRWATRLVFHKRVDEITVDEFFKTVPKTNLLPRAKTQLSEGFQAVYDKFEDELKELKKRRKRS